ncbi:MAG: sigma-54-dependent Fis family transcriptional regulator [Candidatus Aminicenantes bacterium]|nr:sigma-54-dependent Fis family transcriptional regulator [Candidatus Aminicenantes bacterium]
MSICRRSVESFLAKSLRTICEEIPSSRAALAVFDGLRGICEIRFWPGPDPGFESIATVLIRRAAAEGGPLSLENEKGAQPSAGSSGDSEESKLLCLPLRDGKIPVGAVCLGRNPGQTPYSPADVETLVFLTHPFTALIKEHYGNHGRPDETIPVPENDPLIGTSRAAMAIRTLILKVKDSAAPVFVYGESGTGKELVARAIHERGRRRAGPFIALNCGAIPDQLLESELFGHARGSFTGALRDKAGLLEEAGGGTFFLDEIGDLSPALQVKLLRLLQEKELRRVGETRTRRIDVRFISATNKELEKEIERGTFRMDLYYRLRILTIEVPPLRERRDDIPLLVNHFVEKYSLEMGRDRTFVSPRAMEFLVDYRWPGNIRELQNEVQRFLILAGSDRLIREEHLSSKICPHPQSPASVTFNYFAAKAEFEKRFLRQALVRFGHNKARTAGEIGLTRQGLFKLLKKHNLDARPRTCPEP